MSNDAKILKTLGIRVAPEYYNSVRSYAKSHNLSLSDAIRNALDSSMQIDSTEPKTEQIMLKEVSTTFQTALVSVEKQLEQKDQQIEQLHQLLAMKEKSVDETLAQLNRANLQLEDLRKPQTMWQRMKATFVSQPS